jgi:MraZ protein
MAEAERLLLGEFRRTIDERYRLSIPAALSEYFREEQAILAKELPGALSLWRAADWHNKLEAGVLVLEQKLRAGRLENRIGELQLLGRLLSTRHTHVELAGRGRLVIPEGFREFLGVEPGGDVLVVGAAVCVEIWRLDAWLAYVGQNITHFQSLFDRLSQ